MDTILDIRHLSVYFTQYDRGFRRRTITAVKDLSLSVAPGQIVAVVGASGSGKSLLAHSILGLLPYNSHVEGTIIYGGEELSPERAARLRGDEIALIPQGVTYLDPLMKVGEQLCRGRHDPETLRRCREALERYGLGKDTENMYPFELSGGMARRVLIASAVVCSPKLIIADEPTPGLDVQSAGRIMGHFRELADEGTGMLFITHDLELALSVADEIVVFYAGQTVEKVKAGDFEKPEKLKHPFTRALWRAMPSRDFAPAEDLQPETGGILLEDCCPEGDERK